MLGQPRVGRVGRHTVVGVNRLIELALGLVLLRQRVEVLLDLRQLRPLAQQQLQRPDAFAPQLPGHRLTTALKVADALVVDPRCQPRRRQGPRVFRKLPRQPHQRPGRLHLPGRLVVVGRRQVPQRHRADLPAGFVLAPDDLLKQRNCLGRPRRLGLQRHGGLGHQDQAGQRLGLFGAHRAVPTGDEVGERRQVVRVLLQEADKLLLCLGRQLLGQLAVVGADGLRVPVVQVTPQHGRLKVPADPRPVHELFAPVVEGLDLRLGLVPLALKDAQLGQLEQPQQLHLRLGLAGGGLVERVAGGLVVGQLHLGHAGQQQRPVLHAAVRLALGVVLHVGDGLGQQLLPAGARVREVRHVGPHGQAFVKPHPRGLVGQALGEVLQPDHGAGGDPVHVGPPVAQFPVHVVHQRLEVLEPLRRQGRQSPAVRRTALEVQQSAGVRQRLRQADRLGQLEPVGIIRHDRFFGGPRRLGGGLLPLDQTGQVAAGLADELVPLETGCRRSRPWPVPGRPCTASPCRPAPPP